MLLLYVNTQLCESLVHHSCVVFVSLKSRTNVKDTQTYILPLNSCGLKNNRPMLYIQHWWSLPIFIKKYIFQRHTVFYFPFNSLCFSLIWFANLWFANNETCTSPWLVLPLHSTQTAHIFTHTCTHAWRHANSHTGTHTYMYRYTYVCTHEYACMHIRSHTWHRCRYIPS